LIIYICVILIKGYTHSIPFDLEPLASGYIISLYHLRIGGSHLLYPPMGKVWPKSLGLSKVIGELKLANRMAKALP